MKNANLLNPQSALITRESLVYVDQKLKNSHYYRKMERGDDYVMINQLNIDQWKIFIFKKATETEKIYHSRRVTLNRHIVLK